MVYEKQKLIEVTSYTWVNDLNEGGIKSIKEINEIGQKFKARYEMLSGTFFNSNKELEIG
jgi:hypothetical protein